MSAFSKAFGTGGPKLSFFSATTLVRDLRDHFLTIMLGPIEQYQGCGQDMIIHSFLYDKQRCLEKVEPYAKFPAEVLVYGLAYSLVEHQGMQSDTFKTDANGTNDRFHQSVDFLDDFPLLYRACILDRDYAPWLSLLRTFHIKPKPTPISEKSSTQKYQHLRPSRTEEIARSSPVFREEKAIPVTTQKLGTVHSSEVLRNHTSASSTKRRSMFGTISTRTRAQRALPRRVYTPYNSKGTVTFSQQ